MQVIMAIRHWQWQVAIPTCKTPEMLQQPLLPENVRYYLFSAAAGTVLLCSSSYSEELIGYTGFKVVLTLPKAQSAHLYSLHLCLLSIS